MSAIAELRVYNTRDFFGSVDYEGEHVTWDLLALSGQPGAAFSGLCQDPTGAFLMLYPRNVPQDAGTAQWTPAVNPTAYSQSTAPATAGGRLFLRCAPTAAAPAFDTTLKYVRPDDEGFFCEMYRAETSSGTFYLYFSSGRATGTPGLRLALDGGPVRLQLSTDDDASWTDVATAYSFGDSEGYLRSANRYLTVDVLSQCDPDWLPSADSPFGPPGQIVVTLNGGADVLTYSADSLPSGAVRITGTQGQWSVLRYARKLFTPTANVGLPSQVRAAPFQSDPEPFLSGYLPYAEMWEVDVSVINGGSGGGGNQMCVLAGSQAAAVLLIDTPDEGIVTLNAAGQPSATGTAYALRSCYLSAVEASWPSIQTPPNPNAAFVAYAPIYAQCETHFDQGTRTVRRRAVVILQALDNRYAPGQVIPAARAAVLLMGDDSDPALTPVITGWTGLAALDGQEWQWVDWQKHFALIIEDRDRKGDEDQTCCLHMEPFDFQAHYLPVRKCYHKIGVTDEWMTGWPYVGRSGQLLEGGTFGGYYLGGGTAQEPLWQPAPDESVNGFLLKVTEGAGEVDPVSGQIQPMVRGTSPDGHIVYAPLPAGIASAFLTPGQTLSQLGLSSLRDYALRDFLRGRLSSTATLSHIRTPIVFEGLDPSGKAIVGVAANEALGGGPNADPNAFGSVGTNVPYVNISRRFSSPEVMGRAVAVAAVSMGYPSIGASGTLAGLDPVLDVLSVITISDPYTMGTNGAVPFWTNSVSHVVDQRDARHHTGETSFSARLIGQAG